MITFNTDGMVAQHFAFPAPIMDYILNNLQPQHLVKLYPTCKFFFAKYRQNIIRHLELIDEESDEDEMFTPTKTIIRVSNPALKELKDFCISDSFIDRAPLNNSYFFPDFTHCTIKKLEACSPLAWSEYESLTKAGTIQDLKIGKVVHGHELVAIEKLISQVPNATSVEIFESFITPTTCASLASLNHQVKISHFVLGNITSNNFVPIDDFFFKHVDPNCNIRLSFKLMNGDDDFIRQYNELLREREELYIGRVALILERMKHEKRIALLKKEKTELEDELARRNDLA